MTQSTDTTFFSRLLFSLPTVGISRIRSVPQFRCLMLGVVGWILGSLAHVQASPPSSLPTSSLAHSTPKNPSTHATRSANDTWITTHTRWFQGPLPGMPKHSQELAHQLTTTYRLKQRSHSPRTLHIWPNRLPRYSNRLLFESSPYLLQHAHNPVNWYPWGEEAFVLARRTNKPVFLSVGYSTCHWCHVMEKESFENPTMAAYLNRHYIAIKVDREERLDVDGIYMKAVQLFSRGGGGWPMSVWLTPTKKPFFAGTYFPPTDRWGQRGFLSMLQHLHQQFQKNPLHVANHAHQISDHIRKMSRSTPTAGIPSIQVLQKARQIYQRFFDPVSGGMRGRPKFPSSFGNAFLLRYYRRQKDATALAMVKTTLEKMAYGGIYDQIGGGFHRYSTDAQWLVPHFEKMLYDNALLSILYTETFQVTKQPLFARIAQETLDYVLREMTSAEGAFYSATDADSDGHEGTFFLWQPQELDRLLGQPISRYAKTFWGFAFGPNFEGKHILYVPKPLPDTARTLGISPQTLQMAIKHAKQRLYLTRKQRTPPLLDSKIITSWNGLMLSALARAAFVFQRKDYEQQAIRAASFLLQHVRKQGRLLRIYKDSVAKYNAYLEDYAFLIAGLLDLFETTQQLSWFQQAQALQQILHRHHWDTKHGGYFRTSRDHETFFVRPKPSFDGAIPTGNSVQLMNLLRFHTWTTQQNYRKLAEQTLRCFGERLQQWPTALSEMLLALDYYHDAPKEIILIKPTPHTSPEPFLQEIRKIYLPNKIILVTTQDQEQTQWSQVFPLVKKKKAISGKLTAYVCMRQVCELPTTDPAIFAQQLRKIQPLP